MPTTHAAKKWARKTKKRTVTNRDARVALKRLVKQTRSKAQNGHTDEAEKLLSQAVKTLDKAARRGILHVNAAARGKSRLIRFVRSRQSHLQQKA